MHVDESGGLSFAPVAGQSSSHTQSGMRIEVVSSRGESRILTLSPECSVDQLKMTAVSSFHPSDPLTCVKMLPHFRLVLLSRSRKELREGRSLREEELVEGDVLLFLPKYESRTTAMTSTTMSQLTQRSGPTDSEILSATSNLDFKNLSHKAKESVSIDVSLKTYARSLVLIYFISSSGSCGRSS